MTARVLVVDDVDTNVKLLEARLEAIRAAGGNPDELVDLYVDAINEAVKGAPADMALGVHM